MKVALRRTCGSTLLASAFLWHGSLRAESQSDQALQKTISAFIPGFKALEVPELELGYVENIAHIQDLAGIKRQLDFFKTYRTKIQNIAREELEPNNRYERDALLEEINLNLQRLRLEKEYRNSTLTEVSKDGIINLPKGRQWYSYFVRRWTSHNMTPIELLRLGEQEVARVTSEIKSIQSKLGFGNDAAAFYKHLNDPAFLITDESKLTSSLTLIRNSLLMELGRDFEDTETPLVDIKPIKNPNKDTPPGYYDNGVFYFNFFENRFQKRNLEWLFIHEAVPGHHYQNTVKTSRTPLQELFWYPGFTEGWGAYSENLGKDLGRYQDIYQQLGKWEWDLVRSARVVMDVGLNYLGWSKATARKFWQNHIPNQDGIREREIDRMLRWPAQVLSYKVGERTILKLRGQSERQLGSNFDIKKFHSLVLQRGSIPLPVLEDIVNEELK